MVNVIGNIAHTMSGAQFYQPIQGPAQPGVNGAQSPEAIAALAKQKHNDLLGLHRNFFDAAKGGQTNLPGKAAQTFGVMHPREAIYLSDQLKSQTYFSGLPTTGELGTKTEGADHNPASQPGMNPRQNPTFSPAQNIFQPHRRHGATLHGPLNAPSLTQPNLAAQGIGQMQTQTQNFLASMLGDAYSKGNMVDFLGPNAVFEDALVFVMMKIAKENEREIAEKIKHVERGSAGLAGFVSDRARDLGGVVGGAIGGLVSGGSLPAAAVGQDIGERLVGSYAGYNTQESRQIQFEKLKHMMNKMSEMMSSISNILTTMHKTNQNTISNIRG